MRGNGGDERGHRGGEGKDINKGELHLVWEREQGLEMFEGSLLGV